MKNSNYIKAAKLALEKINESDEKKATRIRKLEKALRDLHNDVASEKDAKKAFSIGILEDVYAVLVDKTTKNKDERISELEYALRDLYGNIIFDGAEDRFSSNIIKNAHDVLDNKK